MNRPNKFRRLRRRRSSGTQFEVEGVDAQRTHSGSVNRPGRAVWAGVLLVFYFIFPCFAVSANTDSASSDTADQHIWNLTDYLKGPPGKIRDLVNSELERLTAKQKDLKHRCAGYDSTILAQQAADVNAVRKSAPYLKLLAEKNAAEAALKAARENGSAQDKLDASSNFNRIRMALEKMETDAVASDTKIPQLLKDKREDTAELKRCDEAVDTAQKWRDKLISALRDTYKLRWPLEIGAAGTLGLVTPVEDPDRNGIVVEFQAFEEMKTGGVEEGIARTFGVFHKIRLHVTGIDTTGMSKGTPVALDRNFAVTRKPRRGDDEATYEVRPRKDDVDRLFELLIPLREAPPPK